MIAYIDRSLAKPPTELRNVGNRGVIQNPKQILVERRGAFLDADPDAILQKFVLSIQIPFLNATEELSILCFQDEHGRFAPGLERYERVGTSRSRRTASRADSFVIRAPFGALP